MNLRDGLYHRIFAALMARGGDRYESLVEERKSALFAELSGTVVEIGSGAGANLRFGSEARIWIGIDPNLHMHGYLVEEASSRGVHAMPVPAVGHALPLAEGSADWVLSTLVLCSVTDLEGTLAEIHRVLRPGGRFGFVEHLAAPPGSWLRRIQRVLRPAWKVIADGCHPDRETEVSIRAAGFEDVRLESFRVPVPVVSPHVAGTARKGLGPTSGPRWSGTSG